MGHTFLEKLHWRILFAMGGEPPVVREIFGHNPFPLRERLTFLNPFTRRPTTDQLLLRSRRRDAKGEEYFMLGGNKIYFRPTFPVADEAALIEGTRIVLKEAYLKDEHFSAEVFISPGDTVLDLGGHIGTSALTYSRHTGPEGRVFSFEPLMHELLERNLRANSVTNVRVVPVGLWERPGEAMFHVLDLLINSRIARSPVDQRCGRRVPLTTIDEFTEKEQLDRVDFIKMDIEGAEGPALRGARRTVERFRPVWSVASYHNDPSGVPQHPLLMRAFRELGYRVRELVEHGRPVRLFAW